MHLQGEFAGGNQDEGWVTNVCTLELVRLLFYLVDDRDEEGARLTGAIFGTRDDALALHYQRNGVLLHGGGGLEAQGAQAQQHVFLDSELFEGLVFLGLHVLNYFLCTFVCFLTSFLVSLSLFESSLIIFCI